MRRTSLLILPALLLAACAGDKITDPVASAPVAKTPAGTEVQSSAAARITVLMRGLNAPRGLAWGADGGLYVAEAGTRAVHGPERCEHAGRTIGLGDSWFSPLPRRQPSYAASSSTGDRCRAPALYRALPGARGSGRQYERTRHGNSAGVHRKRAIDGATYRRPARSTYPS
jgi:hypothetical protein